MRISLSNSTYRAIRLPTEDAEFYLGKSVNGIYCASLFEGSQLQVWFLNDPCVDGQTEWVLKHDRDIFSILPNLNYDKHRDGPWILQEFHYWGNKDADDDSPIVYNNEATMEEKFVWDSDNDNVLEPGSRSKGCYIAFLGFHPYKQAVFLSDKFDRVLAYNWNSSKLQDLGKVFPKFYIDWDYYYDHKYVEESFPYTPCFLGELPEKINLEAH
uniref:F-box associated domain-containing protein n=1 Tax=Hordeum vulgare subsp. vulgare TaxID=112509 RepID=A0A8I7BD47_HORVV